MSQIYGRAETIIEKFNSIDDAVQLSYVNVIFPSLVLIAGFAISVSQLAMENIWARIKKRAPMVNKPIGKTPAWKQEQDYM